MVQLFIMKEKIPTKEELKPDSEDAHKEYRSQGLDTISLSV